MSVTPSPRINEHEDLNSQSSDEKMDTASESLLSTQDTPNSIFSPSDFEEKDPVQEETVLRLQNPKATESTVLRLTQPETNKNIPDISAKMPNIKLDTLDLNNRPQNLNISPPKFSSALTQTTSHPLMCLSSPDSTENYPDVIPKNVVMKSDDVNGMSLSCIDDQSNMHEMSSYSDFYSPQSNTSKNNLYYHEHFVTADNQILNDSLRVDNITSPPDVARVERSESLRRRIVPYLKDETSIPQVLCHMTGGDKGEDSMQEYVKQRHLKLGMNTASTPNKDESDAMVIPLKEDEFHSGIAEWCESPSHLRLVPNFDLPIEMKSNISQVAAHKDPESPDVLSGSSDHSVFRAHLDVARGRAALTHRAGATPEAVVRRRIVLPQDDSCSLDSDSVCSLESDGEEPPLAPASCPPTPPAPPEQPAPGEEDDDSSKRSDSSGPELVPELSALEEARERRSFLTITLPDGQTAVCDMNVIEPYKRVVSHGGYSEGAALLVLRGCHLPPRARSDYGYVMDHLHKYIIWSVSRLVTEQYCLIYLHGGSGGRMPSLSHLRLFYSHLDHRLRKSLKHMYLVHPTFWLKTIVICCKPFISSKFFKKLTYVNDLQQLMESVPVDPNTIPDIVKEYDEKLR